MKYQMLLPALAALALSGCVTGYGYSDEGYYYGRQPASVATYGGVGYGNGDWRYGMGYGSPGYYGYYDPYSGYYYDPYYGYYLQRPPIVIIQRPPGDHHDGHGHGGDDHDGDDHDHDDHGHRPPPWRDLDTLGNRAPKPARAPDSSGSYQPRVLQQPPPRDTAPTPRVRMPDPSPPRMRTPEPPPSMPRADDPSTPTRKGDSRL